MNITQLQLKVLIEVVNRSPMSTAEQLVVTQVLNEIVSEVEDQGSQNEESPNQGSQN